MVSKPKLFILAVTFAAPKICHIFEPASTYCGEVIVADISIPEVAIEEEAVSLALLTPKDIQPLVAPRLAQTHKGTYGHVAIIAGCFGYMLWLSPLLGLVALAGAAAAMAAYYALAKRSGDSS